MELSWKTRLLKFKSPHARALREHHKNESDWLIYGARIFDIAMSQRTVGFHLHFREKHFHVAATEKLVYFSRKRL